jgi:hypothetical protein
VTGSRVQTAERRVRVDHGQKVRIRVEVDRNEEVHVHGYDLSADVTQEGLHLLVDLVAATPTGWVQPTRAQARSGTGSRLLALAVDRSGGHVSPTTRLASASTTAGSNWVPAHRRSSSMAWRTVSWGA